MGSDGKRDGCMDGERGGAAVMSNSRFGERGARERVRVPACELVLALTLSSLRPALSILRRLPSFLLSLSSSRCV